MTIKMRAKNFDLFDGAKKGVETELNKLSGMFQEGTVFDVLFTKRDKDFKCKITVQNGRDFVRSEELGKTVEFALNSNQREVHSFGFNVIVFSVGSSKSGNSLRLTL